MQRCGGCGSGPDDVRRLSSRMMQPQSRCMRFRLAVFTNSMLRLIESILITVIYANNLI
jgi:hypothetical protein